ncbi:MAG: type II toxin-antitoxin system ParD family antitoxin [Micrococcales bacterium]|nr:MAG: type II toxin-antitoxin system ParD family antitoxin [Micrococcales bacterium]PIE27583.1 MAG: type II toxin-antitoxin system ParD family antitoxin [Micrococcales bacterium]
MTTQNVPLSDHGRVYAAAAVESGEAKDAAKVEAFREAAQTGLDDLDNGRFTAVALKDLCSFINGLSPRLSQGTPGQ